ncbi:hypothetical protein O9993_15435 [Vibrio lentus]|nr:hypothetical protein [Vibrio lentus]
MTQPRLLLNHCLRFKGYLMSNESNIVSTNQETNAKRRRHILVVFGGLDCKTCGWQ